jgi:hypothetical protein
MSYDRWKTRNPQDDELGSAPQNKGVRHMSPTLGSPHSINEPQEAAAPGPVEALTAAFLDPAEAELGGPDVELHVIGTGFTDACVINFNGGDEPTTMNATTDVYTMIDMSTATTAGAFEVTVRRGEEETDPLLFRFIEPAATTRNAGTGRYQSSRR